MASGRSRTSFETCMRGRYRALSRRHELPRCDGHHITPATAAHKGQYEATSHMPSLLLHPLDRQHSTFHPPVHLVTLHHPRTQPSPIKPPSPLCDAKPTRPGSRFTQASGKVSWSIWFTWDTATHCNIQKCQSAVKGTGCPTVLLSFAPLLDAVLHTLQEPSSL